MIDQSSDKSPFFAYVGRLGSGLRFVDRIGSGVRVSASVVVGRLGSGPRVVGRTLGSWVRVSASFQLFALTAGGKCPWWGGKLSGRGKCPGEYVRGGMSYTRARPPETTTGGSDKIFRMTLSDRGWLSKIFNDTKHSRGLPATADLLVMVVIR